MMTSPDSTTTTEGVLLAAAEDLEKGTAAPGAEPGPAQGVGGEAPPPAVDYMAEARDVVEFWRVLISSVGPSLAEIYDDATCDRLATALGPVMAKYDFDLGRFGPELLLAAVALPLGVRTWQAVQMEKARRQAEATVKRAANGEARPTEPNAPRPVVDQIDPNSLHTRA